MMLEMSKQLLRRLRKHEVRFIFFADKKLFTVVPHDQVYNSIMVRKHDISASCLLPNCSATLW